MKQIYTNRKLWNKTGVCQFPSGYRGAAWHSDLVLLRQPRTGRGKFGVENKDHAIMEFEPAHKAYQNVKRTGFRTFLRKEEKTQEAFAQETQTQRMHIGMNTLAIEEEVPDLQLHVRSNTVFCGRTGGSIVPESDHRKYGSTSGGNRAA